MIRQRAAAVGHRQAERGFARRQVSAEVLEVGRRIGQDLYQFAASFDIVPAELLNKWHQRFTDKCRRNGLDWLNSVG